MRIKTIIINNKKRKKMKKIDYEFGGGIATIFLSLLTGEIFNMASEVDRVKINEKYNGKLFYLSRSGASGKGHLSPTAADNDLVQLPVYRDQITHLSEAYPGEINGVKVMVPMTIKSVGDGWFNSPIVAIVDGVMCFVHETRKLLSFLNGEKPAEDRVYPWNYKTINGTISIKWWSDNANRVSGLNLPYKFHEFVSVFFHEKLKTYLWGSGSLEDIQGFIPRCLKVKLSKKFMSESFCRTGLFGCSVEEISLENWKNRFSDEPFSWESGWVSLKNFIYKRKDNKVYAVYECKRNELSSRFNEELVEYEREFSIFEWYSRPTEEWISEMKKSTFEKAKGDFINAIRWTVDEQKAKIKELLENNPEVMFVVADSLATGNCLPGTQTFMDQYGVKEPISAQALLEHKKFEEMIENSRFRAVVLKKLFNPNSENNFEDSFESSDIAPEETPNDVLEAPVRRIRRGRK